MSFRAFFKNSRKIKQQSRGMASEFVVRAIRGQLETGDEEIFFRPPVFLKVAGVAALVEELKKEENSHVKSVELSQCSVGEEGAVLFGEFLGGCASLRSVTMAHFGLRAAGVAAMLKGALACKTLTSLSLAYSNVTQSEGVVALLQGSESLRELNIEGNSLEAGGAVAVVEAALKRGLLQRLLLASTKLHPQDVQSICSLLETSNQSLSFINLGRNKCDGATAKSIAHLLGRAEERVLEEICLTACSLKDADVVEIANALEHNVSLKSIDLSDNYEMAEPAARALANMLLKNTTLQSLNVGLSSIGNAGCIALLETLKPNRTLTALDMWNSMSNDWLDVCNVAADVLPKNCTLRSLALNGRLIFSNGALVLARALKGHKSLRELRIPAFRFEETNRLVEAISENGSLVSCPGCYEVCDRNAAMHDKARQAVQTLRVLRNAHKKNIFHLLPKDVLKMIAAMVWASKTEIRVWKENTLWYK